MYDISGAPSDFDSFMIKDHQVLDKKYDFKNMPYYAKTKDGKPVINVWGFGFPSRKNTPSQLKNVCAYFQSKGYYIVLGVPYKWRDGGLQSAFTPEDLTCAHML